MKVCAEAARKKHCPLTRKKCLSDDCMLWVEIEEAEVQHVKIPEDLPDFHLGHWEFLGMEPHPERPDGPSYHQYIYHGSGCCSLNKGDF